MARTLKRRDLARVWSRRVCVAVILTASAERAFSNEAGEESSFCRREGLLALADSHRRRGGEMSSTALTPHGQNETIVATTTEP